MKELKMKAIAEALASEIKENREPTTFVQKLNRKVVDKPLVKVFEGGDDNPSLTVIIITPYYIIIIIF